MLLSRVFPRGAKDLTVESVARIPDPDALAQELAARGVEFHKEIQDTDDGLRGFEIRDTDGYVLFFGRPA
jgi:hypothetical protein